MTSLESLDNLDASFLSSQGRPNGKAILLVHDEFTYGRIKITMLVSFNPSGKSKLKIARCMPFWRNHGVCAMENGKEEQRESG